MLRILHFSMTKMAGGPHRLVQALRKHTKHDVRLIDWKRWDLYPHDIVFQEQPERAMELAEQADVIHLHNCLDYESDVFSPIDFRRLQRQGKAFLRQFRSEPKVVARLMKAPLERVRACRMPAVVIAQFQERFYPHARVVRNNVPLNDPQYMPFSGKTAWDIVFSPTNEAKAWVDRWNTKATPETAELLKRIARTSRCTAKVACRLPLQQVLEIKRRCFLLIDELVTGSYHVSGLEGISMAKPTLAFLDDRTQRVLRETTGCQTYPFVNVRLGDAEPVLRHLLRHRDEAEEIGRAGRQWLEEHWSEESIAEDFSEIYTTLLDDPSQIQRQASLRLDSQCHRFHAITLPDLIHDAHVGRFQGCWSRLAAAAKHLAKRHLPQPIQRKVKRQRTRRRQTFLPTGPLP